MDTKLNKLPEIKEPFPVYKKYGGWVKILSPCHYINIELNCTKIEEQKDMATCVNLFLTNGERCTEQEFAQAFERANTYFTNILSRITQQKFIDATEPATEEDCRTAAYEVYERNYDLQEAVNSFI